MRLILSVALVVVCSCRQSLFDAHNERKDASSQSDALPSVRVCPAPCLGDSGGDFDGSATGKNGRWRYLSDHRDRTWASMTAMDGGFFGSNPANSIRSCAANPSATACRALPGALLVSTAGVSALADPAIEFTAEANRTIELQLSVHIPAGGAAQTVRIYRNSREDALFTGPAEADETLNQVVRLDALAGDRFLVALAPPAAGQPDIAVQLHVVDTNVMFPTECQLAVSFSTLSGGTTENACSPDKLTATHDSTPGVPTPALEMGPYPELGQAAKIAQHNYYSAAAVLDRPGDVTVDLWVKLDSIDPGAIVWAFSERNLSSNAGGGVFFRVVNNNTGELRMDAGTVYTSPGVVNSVHVEFTYPQDQRWHFLRVVHKVDGLLEACFDGSLKGSRLASGTLKPNNPPFIGQDPQMGLPAMFIGSVDDVRVLNTALPCD